MYYTWFLGCSGNGVGLSTARSTVCEDGGVVAIQNTVQQILCGRPKHLLLRRVVIKYPIKPKRLIFDPLASRYDGFGEALDRVILRGIKDSAIKSAATRPKQEGRIVIQAFVVYHLDHGA